MEFSGRQALVTGAAQGVGRAVAEMLARAGARVLAVDVSPAVEQLGDVPRTVEQLGDVPPAVEQLGDVPSVAQLSGDDPPAVRPAIQPRILDLGDPAAVGRFADTLLRQEKIDILVNSAATYPRDGILDSTDEEWQHVLQVNVLAAATLSRAVARALVHAGRPGAIVNVGSVQQLLPLPGYSAYVTSKGALNSLTTSLAVELGPHRIRVNEVNLSLINSASLAAKLGDTFDAGKPPPPTLLGRTGTTDEAAEAICFLASDRASFITGAVLSVDGGRRLSRRPDAQLDLTPGATAETPTDHVTPQPTRDAGPLRDHRRPPADTTGHTMLITDVRAFCVAPRWILVRVQTDDGTVGWGESIFPKRREAVLGAIDDLARVVVGSPAARIEETWHRMRRGGFFRGGPVLATASAAIEQALWDIKGRRLGTPVHDLLGGAVRERVRTYAWIGGDRPHDVVEGARTRLAQGFTAVKMNATEELDYIAGHADIDAVVGRVAALRDAFGDQLDVALDFHGRVHRTMVAPLLAELAQFHLLWVEEPLAPGHDDLLASINRPGGIRIATGERLTSRWDFRKLLDAGGVDILQPDVSLTGLGELAKICHMAQSYDVPVIPHCPNGPVSLAASLQVASCCLNVPMHEQSLGMHYHAGYDGLPRGEMFDYLTDPTPLRPVDGWLAVPDGPGLGIELAQHAVDERSGEWRLPDPDWRHADGRIAEW